MNNDMFNDTNYVGRYGQ